MFYFPRRHYYLLCSAIRSKYVFPKRTAAFVFNSSSPLPPATPIRAKRVHVERIYTIFICVKGTHVERSPA